jgi:colanic acid biosynthesis protein WcaH
VALAELGAEVRFEPQPIHLREVMNPTRDVRGHFISLLYLCELASEPREALRATEGSPRDGL